MRRDYYRSTAKSGKHAFHSFLFPSIRTITPSSLFGVSLCELWHWLATKLNGELGLLSSPGLVPEGWRTLRYQLDWSHRRPT